MGSLLNVGGRIAPFTLPIGDTNETLLSTSIIGVRRTILLVPEEDGEEAVKWLRAAREQTGALDEREVTVLIISPNSDSSALYSGLPSPTFQVLSDAYREETLRLGGSPAFYLVGKDGTIKRASRDLPSLEALFNQIDSMPMRQQEMGQVADAERVPRQ